MVQIEALETKIAYLEKYLSELNSIVMDHEKEIDRLKILNGYLKEKISNIEEGLKENIESTPPPHY
jgi:SlyX protein